MQGLVRRLFSGYSFLAFFIIAILNPILNYIFVGNISLHSLILVPFLAISIILLFKFKIKYFQIGIITCLIFLIICYSLPDRRNDELFIFCSLAFFSNGLISDKYFPKLKINKILNLIFLLISIGIVHSFGLAFGFWGNNIQIQDLIGQRVGRIGDISELIPFSIPFLFFYAKSRSQLPLKLLAYTLILLGILRLIATGTRGITLSVLVSVILYFFYLPISLKRLKLKYIIGVLVLIISVLIIRSTLITEQVTKLTNQYLDYNLNRGTNTGIARVDEAKKDMSTFLENPIIGGGFFEAGSKMNTLEEQNSGHFFLTGMLARVGILGTIFFLWAYISYFIKIYKPLKTSIIANYFFLSTTIIVITYFILGNPLYLSMVWPVLPVFWGVVVNYSKNEENSYPVF